MLARRVNRKWFLFFAAFLLAASVISAGVYGARKQQSKPRARAWLTSTPPVISKVRNLEIINARIVRAGTDAAAVAFEIRNNFNLAVMAVDIMCAGAGMTRDGLSDEEHPIVVIEPHSTLAVEMNDELSPGLPIVLSGATFQDGTEEGTKTSLDAIHRARVHERERLKSQREGKAAEGSPSNEQ